MTKEFSYGIFGRLGHQAVIFLENGPFVQKSSFSTGKVATPFSSRPHCYFTWMFPWGSAEV